MGSIVMADTTAAPNNKPVAFKAKPIREPSGAAKKSVIRKTAKGAIKRGMISEKAAAKHLADY
jgi:hypothetical protein